MTQQLAIVTAKHQRDWDRHVHLVFIVCRSAVQDSTSCTPALLMLGRELCTPAEMAFGKAPDTPAVPPGLEYARRLQDRLETAHAFARQQLESAGVRQKRNFDLRTRGRHFQAVVLGLRDSPGLHAEAPVGQGEARPPPQASRRHRSPPGCFRDFVVPSGRETLGGGA
ncbi:hypothetical protein SKAU_G00410420 [Synaphobranchus kaupii]|uniref:Uncharacterized protein n=1 Tax=Synaphobranchus kaupii TaxID=118154 RepID=A0A9Q1E7N1_SYNKA|nr:hypothetical protein SKAU_G00410420 [Synaphobranchus kaupii]